MGFMIPWSVWSGQVCPERNWMAGFSVSAGKAGMSGDRHRAGVRLESVLDYGDDVKTL